MIQHTFLLLILLSVTTLSAQEYIPFNDNGSWGFMNRNTGELKAMGFEEAEYFRSDWALVKKDGQWGAVNINLEMVIPPEHTELTYLSEELLRGKKGDLFYLYHPNTKFKNPYRDAALLKDYVDLIVVADENGKYGLMNLRGKSVIKPKYESPPKELNQGVLQFALRDKSNVSFGAINIQGKEIIPFEYLFVSKYGSDLLKAETVNDQHLYTLEGKRKELPSKEAYQINDHFSIVHGENDNSQVYVTGISEPFIFKNIRFYNDIAIGQNPNDVSLILDKSGKERRFSPDIKLHNLNEGYIHFTRSDTAHGVMSKSGEIVIPAIYPRIELWNNDYVIVGEKKYDGKKGLISMANGDTVLDLDYQAIHLMHCNFFKTYKDTGFIYFNPNLEMVKPVPSIDIIPGKTYLTFEKQTTNEAERKYGQQTQTTDFTFPFDCTVTERLPFKANGVDAITDNYGRNALPGILKVNVRDKYYNYMWFLIDMNGKVITKPEYSAITYHENDQIIIIQRDSIGTGVKSVAGIMDTKGNVIIKPQYDKIINILPHALIVQNYGVLGVVSKSGEEIIPSKYSHIKYDPAGFYLLAKFNKWQIADQKGHIITDKKYDEIIEVYPQSVFKVKLNDQIFFIDDNGKEYHSL